MIKELHTKQVHLTPDGRLEVYDHRIANRLNTILRKYFEDIGILYRFKKGEEAVFKIKSKNQLILVQEILYRKALHKNG